MKFQICAIISQNVSNNKIPKVLQQKYGASLKLRT